MIIGNPNIEVRKYGEVMKWIGKLLLTFIMFFVIILSANAKEEVFKFDWSKYLKSELSYQDIPYDMTITFREGYVNSDIYFYDEPTTKIQYYNFKGEVLSTSTLKNSVVYSMTSVDDNIYIVVYDVKSDLFSLAKLDTKLNKIDEVELPESLKKNIVNISMLLKVYGIDYISTINDELALINPNERKIYVIDKNFKKASTIDMDENSVKKYYPSVYKVETLSNVIMDDYNRFISMDLKNDRIIMSGVNSNCSLILNSVMEDDSNETECKSIGTILMVDNNGKEIWKKNLEEYNIIVNSRFVDDYIVAVGYSLAELSSSIDVSYWTKSAILVFDMEGNLVQKITDGDDTNYLLIEPSVAGFIINKTNGVCRDINLNPILPKDMIYDCSMQLEAYYLPRKITTKIEGKGKIDVVSEAHYGEEITFDAKPENGYVLDSIRIIDSDGNVIKYIDNKFIMPSKDVTIEAAFLPKNPETSDINNLTILTNFMGGFMILILGYKKLKFLR